jgi:ribosomal protein S18 acetylase RimI-like enzyme
VWSDTSAHRLAGAIHQIHMPEISTTAVASGIAERDVSRLDNPIWNALNSEQSAVAEGDWPARRFPAEIGPLSGLAEPTAPAYDDLRGLVDVGGVVALFLDMEQEVMPGWSLERAGLLSQMVLSEDADIAHISLPAEAELRRLTREDVAAMVTLAKLTEPGPFGVRTHELGEFFGMFEYGRLMAMAGQRLHLPGFREVSAVCTHPDARGKGYARALMSEVMARIRSEGETPFLHSFAHNAPAIRVYEDLGFRLRRNLHLAVLRAV